MITVRKIRDAVTKRLQESIEKASSLGTAFLKAVVFPQYIEEQKKRWSSNNTDPDFTGGEWLPLKLDKKGTDYPQRYKERKYKSYRGAGKQKMVRESTLYDAITDQTNGNFQAVFTENSMIVNTTLKYALFLDAGTPKMQKRPISTFSDPWKQGILSDFNLYVWGIK